MPDASEIVKRGEVILIVVVAGMRQRQLFKVVREQTAFGSVPFLVPKKSLPLSALMHASEESQLPVKSGGQALFPKGKGPKDFTGL